MTSTDIIIPTLASTIAMINEYAAAISNDAASDSTLDEMQFDIDCILHRDALQSDDFEYASYSELPADAFDDSSISDLDALRAFSIAAFNLRR